MKSITSTADIKLKPQSRVLFVLYPWSAKSYKMKGRWWRLRDFLLNYRSNPRSVEYMLDLANQFTDNFLNQAKMIDILISPDFNYSFPKKHTSIFKEVFHTFDEVKEKQYDAFVLLFTDAIGLGWKKIETKILADSQASIYIINGRRRMFKLNKNSKRALQTRRFAARAWWLESLFGIYVIVSSVFFWLHDLIFGYPEAS